MSRLHLNARSMNRCIALLLAATSAWAADPSSESPCDSNKVWEWNSSDNRVASWRGRQALEVNPENWQHLQSCSFVLHFANKGVALRTAQEVEFYLAKIREDLELTGADPKRRSHIFIFESEEDWKAFTKSGTLDPWTGGFFDGLDLFYWRKTGLGVLHSNQTLPHEIAHRVLYDKFPSGAVPMALNEGFAEYEARKLAFRYLRPRGYDVKVISKRVTREQFIPAEKLVAMVRYPEGDENVKAFYDLSERLVNLLMEKHPPAKFLDLLQAVANGQSFSLALLKTYAGEYTSMDRFESVFEQYAVLGKNE